MTIKPKKKVAKEKTDPETSDGHASVGHVHSHPHPLGHSHSHQHGHYHHQGATETRLEKSPRVRTSPTRWLPSTSSHEDFPHGHSSLSPNLAIPQSAGFEYENHEVSSCHKRRHRSSPHRTFRKHRNHSGKNTVQSTPSVTSNINNGSILSSIQDSGNDCEEELSGYNSGDEHSHPPAAPENITELEQWFEQALKEKKGYVIKKMGEDGACLFRAVADQVYGDQEMHATVRKHCLDYMAKNAEFYSQYVTEDFKMYINRKRLDSCHGNHLEIQAMTELFNRPVEVYQYSLEPINTFDTAYKTDNAPLRLSYHGNVHYNSIVDPYSASIGVGLGLPGFQPGLAESNLMCDALKNSENVHIEQTMLEDKLRETDWEVTQDSIDEQVARESYLQWLREQEKASRRTKGSTRSASATCSSTSEGHHSSQPDSGPVRSPRQLRSGNNSPQAASAAEDHLMFLPGSSKSPRHSPPQSFPTSSDFKPTPASASEGACGYGFNETSSLMNDFAPSLYGLSDWSEEDIIAQVIAQSQQEYLDTLKKRTVGSDMPSSSSSSRPSQQSPPSSLHTLNSSESAGCSGASTSYQSSNSKYSGNTNS